MRTRTDWTAVDGALAARERVLTHAELRELGVASSTITRRIGARGPWQRLLPGVVLAHRGTPTRRELVRGALAFCGPGAVITGFDALRAHGAQLRLTGPVHVLVPMDRQRKSFGFVQVERTARLPLARVRDGIPYAPVARATIDACRSTESLNGVREIVAGIVQPGRCNVSALAEEVRAGARQRTAAARLVLAEVGAGVRSVAEAQARMAFDRYGVPQPLWNVQLRGPDGEPLLTPDGWWPEHAAALEIDSMAWHLRPEMWRRTQRRQRLLTTHGILVLAFSPLEIVEDPESFARDVRRLLQTAGRREARFVTVAPRA